MARMVEFEQASGALLGRDKSVFRRPAPADWLEPETYIKPVKSADPAESEQTIFIDGTLLRVTDVTKHPLSSVARRDTDCSRCGGTGTVAVLRDGGWRYYGKCIRCGGSGSHNRECYFEGVPEMSGERFVEWFCDRYGCDEDANVLRAEFEYVSDAESGGGTIDDVLSRVESAVEQLNDKHRGRWYYDTREEPNEFAENEWETITRDVVRYEYRSGSAEAAEVRKSDIARFMGVVDPRTVMRLVQELREHRGEKYTVEMFGEGSK